MKPLLIGYASDLAANIKGSSKAPFVLQKSKFLLPLKLQWKAMLETDREERQLEAVDAVAEICKQLAAYTEQFTYQHTPFVTIGGDHSAAIGTWSGVANGLEGLLGLIWIDAHMDSHTPQTSISKNIHGMPLAVLLGYGNEKLTGIVERNHPALLPENVVLIGVRSFEREEEELLRSLQVRIYFIEEINERGLQIVMQEAIQKVLKNSTSLCISIDLDAIDPMLASGVNTPEKNGLQLEDFLKSLEIVARNPLFFSAEIVEFNPKNDKNQNTEKIVARLIETLFSK